MIPSKEIRTAREYMEKSQMFGEIVLNPSFPLRTRRPLRLKYTHGARTQFRPLH